MLAKDRKESIKFQNSLSIVIPVIEFDNRLKRLIKSIITSRGLNNCFDIEIILICHSSPVNIARFFINGYPKKKNLSFKVIRYTDARGPSPSWCYGAKKAKNEYILFLAADTFLEINSIQNLLNKIDSNTCFYSLNYSYPFCINKKIFRVESIIDQERFNCNKIDFRGFCCKRKEFISILMKYFDNKYCTDVEFNFIKDCLKLKTKRIPEAKIINFYPSNSFIAIKRKVKHGMGCGRIFRKFCLSYIPKNCSKRNYIKFYLAPFYINWKRAFNILRCKKYTILDRLQVALFNIIFAFGITIGYLLPQKIIKYIYEFHFEKE